MLYGKHTTRGVRDRINVLIETNVLSSPSMLQALNSDDAATDVVLDAIVTFWRAERIQKGCAVCIPQQPEIDSKRLLMWRYGVD
jgi:predicted RNase H-like nuclease